MPDSLVLLGLTLHLRADVDIRGQRRSADCAALEKIVGQRSTVFLGSADVAALATQQPGQPDQKRYQATYQAGQQAEVRLLQCIFGNPFRGVSIDPACQAGTIAKLARAAYDKLQLPSGQLDPKCLAILADALDKGVAATRRCNSSLRDATAIRVAAASLRRRPRAGLTHFRQRSNTLLPDKTMSFASFPMEYRPTAAGRRRE